MVQWHLAGGRYALGVFDLHSTADGASQLQRARKQVAQTLWAMPVIGEVGLYAIFCGTCDKWSPHIASMPADKTGLHRVIVQAVHCIDLDAQVHKLNQSKWSLDEITGTDTNLEFRFGRVDQVASRVIQLVQQGPDWW